MDQGVQGNDRIERASGEVDVQEVGPDELREGNQPTGTPNLPVRDVHASDAEPAGESPGNGYPAPASEVEDRGA